jgi:hypothetical protein
LGWDAVAKVGEEGGWGTTGASNGDGEVEGAGTQASELGFEGVELEAVLKEG